MNTQYEWHMRRKELKTVWEQRPVGRLLLHLHELQTVYTYLPPGFQPDAFITERKEVLGSDGVKIPVTLIRSRNMKLDRR